MIFRFSIGSHGTMLHLAAVGFKSFLDGSVRRKVQMRL